MSSETIAERAIGIMQYARAQDMLLLLSNRHRSAINAVAEVLEPLPAGAFLLGCGPYVCGLFPLSTDEIVLGRPASPLESPRDKVTDYLFNDAVLLLPREISRVHATIVRTVNEEDSTYDYAVRDEESTTGTFINGDRIGHDPELPNPAPLTHGDALQLGPSGVNTHVFLEVPESD